jgi:hypothetical protein
MEDALISPLGFMILTGAGLIEGKGSAGEKELKLFKFILQIQLLWVMVLALTKLNL